MGLSSGDHTTLNLPLAIIGTNYAGLLSCRTKDSKEINQSAFTCSKLLMKTSKQYLKFVPS